MMGVDEFKPDLLKLHRYAHAIPQYGPESIEKLAVIGELEKDNPGLIFAGNVRDGIGMSDRIKAGTQHRSPIAWKQLIRKGKDEK